MSDDIKTTDEEVTQKEASTDAPTTEQSNSEQSEVERLQAELERAKANLAKARSVESKVKQTKTELEAMLAEKASYEDKYKALLEEVNTERVNSALDRKLAEMGAKDKELLKYAIKREGLIGEDGKVNDEALNAVLVELRKNHPSQFDEVEVPTPKRASDGSKVLSLKEQLLKAKSAEEVAEMLKNFNK